MRRRVPAPWCVIVVLVALALPLGAHAQESELDQAGVAHRPTPPTGLVPADQIAPATPSTDEAAPTPAAPEAAAPTPAPAVIPSASYFPEEAATPTPAKTAPTAVPAPSRRATPAPRPRSRPISRDYDARGTFGIGITTQDSLVIGATLKLHLGGPWAIQGSAGFSAWPLAFLGFESSLDLLYEMPRVYRNTVVSLNWYLGAGGTFGVNTPCVADFYCSSSPTGGLQAVGGFAVQFRKVPVEATFELRPTLTFTAAADPFVSWYPGVALAIRWFFF